MVRRRLGNANWKRAGTPLSERIAMGSPRSTNRRSKVTKLANEITQALKSDEGKEILKNIRTLRERFEPEVVAKEECFSRSPGKGRERKPIAREEGVRHGRCLRSTDLFSVHFLVYATKLFESFG
jgi:hypothetical protein